MNQQLRQDADRIIADAIHAVLPDQAVIRALEEASFPGRIRLVAAGKAAWQMAQAASKALGDSLECGVICTKYGHCGGKLPKITCCEGGHPIPDENSLRATDAALSLVQGLTAQDTVLFLLSGGGSALLEKPLIPLHELQDITQQLLASGASIVEINAIRKRLSAVKGGRFAKLCQPARVFSIVLSDILGDPLDMIASGPACPDASTCGEALSIAARYHLRLSPEAMSLLHQETPKALSNVETHVTGSVRELCAAAAAACSSLGYTPHCAHGCLVLSGTRRRAGTFRHCSDACAGWAEARFPDGRRNGRARHRPWKRRAQSGACPCRCTGIIRNHQCGCF